MKSQASAPSHISVKNKPSRLWSKIRSCTIKDLFIAKLWSERTFGIDSRLCRLEVGFSEVLYKCCSLLMMTGIWNVRHELFESIWTAVDDDDGGHSMIIIKWLSPALFSTKSCLCVYLIVKCFVLTQNKDAAKTTEFIKARIANNTLFNKKQNAAKEAWE